MAGPLALVGSGEYLPAMADVDRALLAAAPRQTGTILLVPAASGLEPGMPAEWNRRGVEHFTGMGFAAEGLPIATRDDLDAERYPEQARAARMIYFSGGNPDHLLKTLVGTPFWDAVLGAYANGAVLAGCSAGAMVLASHLQTLRGQMGQCADALGIVPDSVIVPHFDRVESFRPGMIDALRAGRPPGTRLIGVDEVTALTFFAERWQVLGQKSVLIVDEQGERRYNAGENVAMPPPRSERALSD
jgi:cyanophycinase-like exopeptidase